MTDDADTKRQRYLRAKEVLQEAGWLFDDFVNAEMKRVLTSSPDESAIRETAYLRARVAAELKTGLAGLVQEYDRDQQMAERREQAKEKKPHV